MHPPATAFSKDQQIPVPIVENDNLWLNDFEHGAYNNGNIASYAKETRRIAYRAAQDRQCANWQRLLENGLLNEVGTYLRRSNFLADDVTLPLPCSCQCPSQLHRIECVYVYGISRHFYLHTCN